MPTLFAIEASKTVQQTRKADDLLRVKTGLVGVHKNRLIEHAQYMILIRNEPLHVISNNVAF